MSIWYPLLSYQSQEYTLNIAKISSTDIPHAQEGSKSKTHRKRQIDTALTLVWHAHAGGNILLSTAPKSPEPKVSSSARISV
jgi:hypothetical protein